MLLTTILNTANSNDPILGSINLLEQLTELKNSRETFSLLIMCVCLASSVQSLSHVQLCDPMDCRTPGLPVHHQLLEFTQTHISIESVMPSNHLILCCPLLLLPSIFPSIRVFSHESVCIRWPKYWSFSFSISPSNEYLGLISFRMDWLDLLAVQRTLKGLLQHLFKSLQPCGL